MLEDMRRNRNMWIILMNKKSKEVVFEYPQILDLADKDIKAEIINMLKQTSQKDKYHVFSHVWKVKMSA
jgi:hypothetical protein